MRRTALLTTTLCAALLAWACAPQSPARETDADTGKTGGDTPKAETETPAPQKAPPALGDYVQTGETVRVEGIPDNLSGVAWSPETKTLFGVLNGPTAVVELSTEGKVLRRIDLKGFSDAEGIAHLDGKRFAVAEEGRHTIVLIDIDKDTAEVSREGAHIVGVRPELAGTNAGLEGVAWDAAGKRFIGIKEKLPRGVYAVPLAAADVQPPAEPLWDAEKDALGLRDIADVYYMAGPGHLLLLSHESLALVECTPDGREVARLSLADIRELPKPEGVTMDDEGNIYVVGEPNSFAVLKPGTAP